MEKTRVLIVDDHTLIRDGIRALLALATNIEVVGEASNGMEALEKVRELSPHLVLMDLAMALDTKRDPEASEIFKSLSRSPDAEVRNLAKMMAGVDESEGFIKL